MNYFLNLLSYGYGYDESDAVEDVGFSAGYIIGLVIVCLLFGLICDRIVASKGYDREDNHGFLWGFFLTWIGVIVCALKESCNHSTHIYQSSSDSSSQRETLFKGDAESNDGWTCVCGARNKDYEGTCHRCGKSKHEQKEARAAIQTAVDQRKITTSADDTAQQIKDYKKLLDDGLITEEEFTAKKRSILGI